MANKTLARLYHYNLDNQFVCLLESRKAKTMAALPPPALLIVDPGDAAAAAVAAASAAAALVGGVAGQGAPLGAPPPPPALSVLPLASPGAISRAIWSKVPEALRNQHAGKEMANYLALLNGGTPHPEALALAVTTSALEPMCFLTCRETSSTAIPTIELIHSIGNYVVALGQVDDLHGHSFAFVGETTGDQLPSAFLEPAVGIAATIVRRNVPVPDLATVRGHYAQPGASVLMPSGTGGPNADVASVCMIPLMWAPYFIDGGTPNATLAKIEQLVAASAVEHRISFSFIQDWGRFSCVAEGPQVPQSHRPSVAVGWRDFPRDRQYTEWATQRFQSVYKIVPPPLVAPAPAAGGGATDPNASIAAAIVAGLQVASQAERDKKEKYAYHEKLSILAACGLHPDDWEQAPPIYNKITQDGRTLSAVRVALEQEYRETVLASEFPSSVFFSTQLVSDVKDIKFGWQDSQAYASCHRGVSPFALPHTSIESHQALRALEEDAAMATSTTISDMRASRTGPPPCPTDYYGLLQLLCSYIKLLMMLFGANCDHLIQVSAIYFLVKERVAMFQLMTKEQVAHLLWAVFIDARTYFSSAHDQMGNPPVSRLDWLVSAMRGGSLPSTMGTPLLSMFGNTRDGPRNPLLGTGTQNGSRSEAGGPPYTNSQVHAKIAEATAEAMRCSSTVNFRAVSATAAAPKPQLGSLSLFRGGCFDYLFFGKCTAARCTYKHDGQITEAKIDGVISKMRPALAQFVTADA